MRLPSLALLVVLLAAWELAARLSGVSALVLPAPSAVARSLWSGVASGYLWPHLLATAAELLADWLLALGSWLSHPDVSTFFARHFKAADRSRTCETSLRKKSVRPHSAAFRFSPSPRLPVHPSLAVQSRGQESNPLAPLYKRGP